MGIALVVVSVILADPIFKGLAIALIAYGVVNHSWIGAIGAVPLLTAMIGLCPAYCPLHLSTVGKGDDSGGCCGGSK